MNPKTGLVAVTIAVEAICGTLRRYRPKMNVAISAAVTAGLIDGGQAAILSAFLDSVQGACDILKIITGY